MFLDLLQSFAFNHSSTSVYASFSNILLSTFLLFSVSTLHTFQPIISHYISKLCVQCHIISCLPAVSLSPNDERFFLVHCMRSQLYLYHFARTHDKTKVNTLTSVSDTLYSILVRWVVSTNIMQLNEFDNISLAYDLGSAQAPTSFALTKPLEVILWQKFRMITSTTV